MRLFRVLLAALGVLVSIHSSAGDQVVKQVVSGEDIQNAKFVVVDQEYGSTATFHTLKQRAKIKLYEISDEKFSSSPWTLKVYYSAELTFSDGLVTTQTDSLILYGELADDVPVLNIDQHIFEGVSYAAIDVTGIDFSNDLGPIASIPEDFHLEVAIETERYYPINTSTTPVVNSVVYISPTNELKLSWDYIQGAEEYELEYLFIADGEETGNHQSQSITYDFKNATRIHLPENFYSLSLSYPKGSILYRVRGVGYDLNYTEFREHKVFTPWSYEPVFANRNISHAVGDDATTECYYYTPGVDGSKNWTYTATYAEDGKRKEVASYADGSGRTRQQVTINNTDKNAIVAETKYDFAGRPAVQLLPGITQTEGIKFYGDSANPINGFWDKYNFGTDSHLNDNNDTLPEALPADGITSQYYSSTNNLDFLNKEALPEAEGYAYSLTQYRNDGTDRPVAQTQVGQELRYQANGGKMTKYFYGVPTQSEIDRLFGSEAGYAQFYKKNLVIDVNGQQSIQYLDASGRTVATALGGDNPSTLDSIGDKSSETITTPLFDVPGSTSTTGKLVESTKFICSVPQRLDLSYQLDTNIYSTCGILNRALTYNLTFEIRNSKDQLVLDTTLNDIDQLNTASLLFWDAKIGNYSITRTVEVNEQSKAAYIVSLDSAIEESRAGTPNPCFPMYNLSADTICGSLDCDSACFQSFTLMENGVLIYLDEDAERYAPTSGNPNNYYAEADPSQVWSVTDASAPFNMAIDQCVEDCLNQDRDAYDFFAEDRCDMKFQSLSIDIKPGGMYAIDPCDTVYCFTYGFSIAQGIYDSLILQSGSTPVYTFYNVEVKNNTVCVDVDPGSGDNIHLWNNGTVESTEIENFSPSYDCDTAEVVCDTLYCTATGTVADGMYDLRLEYSGSSDVFVYNLQVVNNTVCLDFDPGDPTYAYLLNGTSVVADVPGDFIASHQCETVTRLKPADFAVLGGLLGITVTSWDDVYRQWQPGFENVILEYHPEYCAYDFFCNYVEDCGAGGGTLSMQNIQHYQGVMYDAPTYADALAYTFDQVQYNLMNPLGLSPTSSNGYFTDNEDYIMEGQALAFDPLIACGNGNPETLAGYAEVNLSSMLQEFVTVKTSGGDFLGYYSLWYLLDDPDGIADGSGGNNTGLDTTIIRLFNMFHGDGSCNPGIIVSNEEKLIFFRSIYLFLREKVMYDYFKNVYECSGGGQYAYWNGDTNYDGVIDNTNIVLNYRRNALFELYDDFSDTTIFNSIIEGTDGIQTNISYREMDECSCEKLTTYLDSVGIGSSAPPEDIAVHLNAAFCQSFSANDITNILQCNLVEDFANFDYVYTLPAELKCGPSDIYLGNATEDCSANLARLAHEYADKKWEEDKLAFIDSVSGHYELYAYAQYKDYETTGVVYTLGEYHYTLYYYDLAGNLVKTIPPAGVDFLSSSEISDVQSFRRDSISGAYTRPNHDYVTVYQYNTQNQVKAQTTPDGGRTEFWYDDNSRIVASQNARQTNLYSYTLYDGLGRVVESGQVSGAGLVDTTASDPDGFYDFLTSAGATRDQVVFTLYNEPLYEINGTGSTEDEISEAFDNGQEYLRNRVASVFYYSTMPDTNIYIYNNKKDPQIPAGYKNYESATHYSYDPHGNVKTLVQEFPGLAGYGRRFFRIDYEYDLVSGNVIKVSYQAGEPDQFFHRYFYDANNRLERVQTSSNGEIWDEDARYFYYPHGPLSRMELGDMNIQGLDYAYTLQGWLKAVNGTSLGENRPFGDYDLGSDGAPNGNLNQVFAPDAFGFGLEYYQGDYSGIQDPDFMAEIPSGNIIGLTQRSLYNGNISRMINVFNDNVEDPVEVAANNYIYDQLNRLTGFTTYSETSLNEDNTGIGAVSSYKGTYFYDPNGNIKRLKRWNGDGVLMDNLNYYYDTTAVAAPKRNRLTYVDDAAGVQNTTDLGAQSANNYSYDATGNLVSDAAENLSNIVWNLQGKISEIQKSAHSYLEFGYDPMGNRIRKTNSNIGESTYYVRDAQGNPMATYLDDGSSLKLEELMVYGSDRLGVLDTSVLILPELLDAIEGPNLFLEPWQRYEFSPGGGITSFWFSNGSSDYVLIIEPQEDISIGYANVTPLYGQYIDNGSSYTIPAGASMAVSCSGNVSMATIERFAVTSPTGAFLNNFTGGFTRGGGNHLTQREVGRKHYELKNHLGNVLSVVSDRKIWKQVDGVTTMLAQQDFTSLPEQSLAFSLDEWMPIDDAYIEPEGEVIMIYSEADRSGGRHNFSTGADCYYRYCLTLDNIPKEAFISIYSSSFGQYVVRDEALRSTTEEVTLCWDISAYGSGQFEVTITLPEGEQILILNEELYKTALPSGWSVSGTPPCLSPSVDGLVIPFDGEETPVVEYSMDVDPSCDHRVCFSYVAENAQGQLTVRDESHTVLHTEYFSGINSTCFTLEEGTYSSLTFQFETFEGESVTLAGMSLESICSIEAQVANVLSAQDYYPFGMVMPGRNYQGSEDYRYGFNGKEMDNEVSGNGNQYDYGFRIYNPRLGRFLSVDPLTKSFPWYTPYQFAGNKPIWAIDLDGLEEFIYQYTLVDDDATLIQKVDNGETKPVFGGHGSAVFETIDKRTGKPMNPDEVGKAQYQYFDEDGNRLNIRRNLTGDYVEGENEFVEDWTENIDGSVYIGSNNPPQVDGQEDYRREPQDEADAIAEEHDKDFDAAGLKGFSGTMSDESTPANEKAINSAEELVKKEKDKVTGKPVTEKTKSRAKTIMLFKAAEAIKSIF